MLQILFGLFFLCFALFGDGNFLHTPMLANIHFTVLLKQKLAYGHTSTYYAFPSISTLKSVSH